jgi:hypothetical protein
LKRLQVFKQKEAKIQKIMKRKWKKIWRSYMHKRLFWKPNNRNALCCLFYCVNDNKEIDFIGLQIMCCIFCYNNPIFNLNPKIQVRKGLIKYNTINGIIALKKHVNLNHSNL